MSIDEPVDRREFLRILGKAAAVLGAGPSLGGVFAACDDNGAASNTTATVAMGETTLTTVAPSTTTSVAVQPEAGRPIRLGVVSAKSGPLALFGRADDWWIGLGSEAVRDGIVCGDGKLRGVAFSVKDCHSEPDTAARLAMKLISDERVDLLLCSGGSAVVNAVAGQAEAIGCPCLADFVEWQSFVFGRGGTADEPFKWTYAHAIGLEDLAANYLAMWGRLGTNKKVGLVLPDDIDGQMWVDPASGLPALASAAGYECVVPGLYPAASADFAVYVDEFKASGCEICFCHMHTTEFLIFWKQAVEQSFQPKAVTVSDGLRFPQALETVGSDGVNMTSECLWQPSWPYTDSLTGKTAQELADDYQITTGDQWTAAIAQYAKFEWAVEVFRKARSIIDKEDIIAEVRTAKLDTCRGALDFTIPVSKVDPSRTRRPAANVYKVPVGGAQWVESSQFSFEPRLVSRVNSPDLMVSGVTRPMVYQ